MADVQFNVSKGRAVELANRVQTNDPANSALIVVPVSVGAVTDATLKDFTTLAAVLAGGVTERTTNGWNRKTLTDAVLSAITIDQTNDRAEFTIPDQTWTAVGSGGGATTHLLICYDSDTTGGTDANVIPIGAWDFAITPDGSDVVADAGTAVLRSS